jgi:GTP-binding protein Era
VTVDNGTADNAADNTTGIVPDSSASGTSGHAGAADANEAVVTETAVTEPAASSDESHGKKVRKPRGGTSEPQRDEVEGDYRAGFVSFVGRPNVGKRWPSHRRSRKPRAAPSGASCTAKTVS